MHLRSILLAAGLAAAITPMALAWDYEGHRLVNQVALKALPADFPDFVRAPDNAERIAFLSGEPDRWRNSADQPLQHMNGMDHYFDLEEVPHAGLDVAQLSPFRFEFATQFAQGRAAHADRFRPIDPLKNQDRTKEWPGFIPWAVMENYAKLRSAFSYLKAYEELGRPDEIANAKANILYVMGVMGHYVGDCSQPLHTSMHHHGWAGENPNGYTTWTGIHSWIDGGFLAKAGVRLAHVERHVTVAQPISLEPRADGRDPMFTAVLEYLLAQNRLVEPLYRLEKAGKLGHHEQPIVPEGREFMERRLAAGGQMLAVIWTTAWRSAGPDKYLLNLLANRKARESGLMPPPPSPLPAPKGK